MGFRFQRRIRLLPGVRLNISKSGVTTSIGARGARVTLGGGRTRTTVGIPGTGLSHTTVESSERSAHKPQQRGGMGMGKLFLLGFILLFAVMFLSTAVAEKSPSSYVLAGAFVALFVWIIVRHHRRAPPVDDAPNFPGNKSAAQEQIDLHELFKPALAKTPQECYEWPKNSGVEVAVSGVSFYSGNLARIVGALNGEDAVHKTVAAALIPYQHPKFGAAVAVVIDGSTVGHIGKDDVGEFMDALKRLRHSGQVTACTATVAGRVIPKENGPVYWARLDLNIDGGA